MKSLCLRLLAALLVWAMVFPVMADIGADPGFEAEILYQDPQGVLLGRDYAAFSPGKMNTPLWMLLFRKAIS